MATQYPIPSKHELSAVDLEPTAELPTLPSAAAVLPATAAAPRSAPDPLSATDTWISPTLGRASEPQLDSLREAEIGALRSDLAHVNESRGKLEHNLQNLTTNLRELEQLLISKSEQLSVFEREVGLRDRRITELEAHGAMLAEQRTAITTERDLLRSQLNTTQADAAALRTLLEARETDASGWLKEYQAQTRRVRDLEADLASARAHTERHRETLQSLEGRRQVFETMLLEGESGLSEREARIAALERELAERVKLSGERDDSLGTQLRTEQQRVRELEALLTALRSQSELQRAQSEATAKALQERAERATQTAQEQTEAAAKAAQEQVGAAAKAAQEQVGAAAKAAREQADAAARTAHEQIAALQAQVKAQTQTIDELRASLDQVGNSLNQRNALITRLETETASSAAVLGHIHENLQRMGEGEPTRLLVRTEGDTGIVHRLGRRTTIGRTPDNDLRIDEDYISRHHAVVLLSGSNTIVEDLNSTNGTYVNGERITRATLKKGDLLTVGKSGFRLLVKPAVEHADVEHAQ